MGARTVTWLDSDCRIDHSSDVLSREVARKLAGGGVVESAYDVMGRLAQRTVRSPLTVASVGAHQPDWIGRRDDGVTATTFYRYDADGELVAKVDRDRGTTGYQYDPVGQLLAAIPDKARAEIFRYDPTGNPSEGSGDQAARVYGPGNRLLRRGDTDYEWDAHGRLVGKTVHTPEGGRTWRYQWGGGMLRSATTPEGHVVEFAYDSFARRVSKRVLTRDGLAWKTVSRTRFVWEGDVLSHEIREHAAADGDPVIEERFYAFSDDGLQPQAQGIRSRRGDSWEHYVNDSGGRPEHLIDGTGRVKLACERSVWGAATPEQARRVPFALPGQYLDEETGLAYNRFRYYDCEVGLFRSTDPLGLPGGLNTYRYASNPVGWADPMGLAPMAVIGEGQSTSVAPLATQLGAEQIGSVWPTDPAAIKAKGGAMAVNRAWIKDKIAQGCVVVDTGPDGKHDPPSPFLAMERRELAAAGYQQSTAKVSAIVGPNGSRVPLPAGSSVWWPPKKP
jgi:RHS repeat-associated protein